MKSPHLKLVSYYNIPFCFCKDAVKMESENDKSIIGYEEFRRAIYFAVDREEYTSTVRKPETQHTFLRPITSQVKKTQLLTVIANQVKVLADYSPKLAMIVKANVICRSIKRQLQMAN